MKRFVLVLALVAVAGATYVATAPGSQSAAGPTARQFNTLKRQVAALKRQVRNANQNVNAVAGFLLTCMAHAPVGVNSVGDDLNGYLFGAPGTPPASATSTSALTLDTSQAPTYEFFTVNQSEPVCVYIISSAAGRREARLMSAFRNH